MADDPSIKLTEDDSQIDDEFRLHFHVFDTNGSGFIEREELKESLSRLGYPVTDEGCDRIFQLVHSQDDRLNLNEFIRWNRELFRLDMVKEFKSIDTSHDGTIDKSELTEHSKKMKYGLTEEQIEDFLYEIDSNGNDLVGLDEYIAATAASWTGRPYFILNAEMYLARLQQDFKDVDVNGDGVITKEDLRQKAKDIQYFLSEEELELTIQSMDTDGDGTISLEEFVLAAVQKRGRK